MRIVIDVSQIVAEVQRGQGQGGKIHQAAKEAVMSAAMTVQRKAKEQMPVDTGAARARWGSPGAAGGVWQVENEGLEIEQGANLEPYEYIERLNEGHSTQAPAGFLDVIAEQSAESFVKEFEQALSRLGL